MIVIMGAIIAVDLLAVALWPFAVHQAGEYGSALAGSWKGIHNHKNSAGALAGAAMILLFGTAVYRRSLGHAAWAVLAAVMLLGSYSKTSTAFALAAIVIGVIAEKATPGSLMRRVGIVGAIIAMIAVFLVVAFTDERVWVEFLDPENFTGRMEIWYLLTQYISDHFWLGSGYGAFWKIGDESPITVMTESWIAGTGSGHNGYLDLLAETGIFGLLLGVQAFAISNISAFFRNAGLPREYRYAGMALLAYFMLRNFLESGFLLDYQMPIWVLASAIRTDMSGSSGKSSATDGSMSNLK
jgi:exopolysaccharide production protein ExoQ